MTATTSPSITARETRHGQWVTINGNEHEVQSVDEFGGIYTRHFPADGSGTTAHYFGGSTPVEVCPPFSGAIGQ